MRSKESSLRKFKLKNLQLEKNYNKRKENIILSHHHNNDCVSLGLFLLTFKHLRKEISEIIPILFSPKFRNSNFKLVFKCSMDLIWLPSKFKCVKCMHSLRASIVKIPL